MKSIKILMTAAAAVTILASCQVYEGNTPTASSDSLFRVADKTFNNLVEAPAGFLYYMDGSMSYYIYELTEEEQQVSAIRYELNRIGENVWYVDGFGRVDTGGTSISEVGAQWKLAVGAWPCWNVISTSSSIGFGKETDVVISCVADGQWTVSMIPAADLYDTDEFSSNLNIKFNSFSSDNSVYEIYGSGTWRDGSYSSSFEILEDNCVTMIIGSQNAFYGSMRVNFYNGEENVDFCNLSFRGVNTQCSTSRD